MFEPRGFGLAARDGGFRADRRFGGRPAAAADPPDPLGAAFERGYAQGFDAAQTLAAQLAGERAADAAARERLIAHLDCETRARLARRLRETVLALCEATVTAAALDPGALAERIERALAMLSRSEDERIIRLHPDDIAALGSHLPPQWAVEPDPALDRGALRIEAANGGIEDGPEQWRRALAEALGGC